jgi:hypothetical protein
MRRNPPNSEREDEDKAQARERDGWMPHVGRHHFAPCGDWRPILGNRDCPRCPVKCACGTYYATPFEPRP